MPPRLRFAATATSEIPSAKWALCGVTSGKFKVVKDYTRLRASTAMSRTYARLYCGIPRDEGSTDAFGYRHIKLGHATDWQRKADYVQLHWHDLAGWAMSYTFRDPDRVTKQTKRFCYQRKFYLADDDGNVVSTMVAIMALGETGVRIMTAFPTTAGKCSGTEIYKQ